MAPVEEASRLAAGTVLSGPAGGISGARRCADLLGIPDLVPFDMGGTSTDISLISEGRASLSADGMLAGQRIALRSLDIASIAAGGGSIAIVDAGGTLRVGPESAGSVPGPACYGNGGAGRHRHRRQCRARLSRCRAPSWAARVRSTRGGRSRGRPGRGVARICRGIEAAAGIYRMINLKMADGIRLMTLRRGVDPRKFALLSFGGAAGLHAAEVARELEIKRIIVPMAASVLSAWGMLTSDLRYEVSRTHYGAAARISADEARSLFAGLEQQATGRLRSWFGGPMTTERSAEMRYGEQIFEIDVALDGLDWNAADAGRPDRGPLPPPPRGTLHLRLARPGSRVRQRARRRGRRSLAARAGRAADAVGGSLRAARHAAGLVRRLARRPGLCARRPAGPATRWRDPRSSRPRPPRWWSMPATASASMRWAGWILR